MRPCLLRLGRSLLLVHQPFRLPGVFNSAEFTRELHHEDAQICINRMCRLRLAAGRWVCGRLRAVSGTPLCGTSPASTTGLLRATLLPRTLLLRSLLLRVLRTSILASLPVLWSLSVLAWPAFRFLRASALGRSVARPRAPVVVAIHTRA
jgi:hypothetical protein